MAKTKIDDLPKGTEEMNAEEQKAAKGGAVAVKMATLTAAQIGTLAAVTTLQAPTRLEEEVDPALTAIDPMLKK